MAQILDQGLSFLTSLIVTATPNLLGVGISNAAESHSQTGLVTEITQIGTPGTSRQVGILTTSPTNTPNDTVMLAAVWTAGQDVVIQEVGWFSKTGLCIARDVITPTTVPNGSSILVTMTMALSSG